MNDFTILFDGEDGPKHGMGEPVGCDLCPLNSEKRPKVINIDRIRGKRLMVWAMCPGGKEEEEGLELIGPSGELFWREMRKVGLDRNDADVQNVVRCRPTKRGEYGNRVNRDPTTEEIRHCSYHTVRAVAKNKRKAVCWVVLGEVAAKTLFPSEFRKDAPIFWSEKRNVKVFCLDHPSYFLRGVAPAWRVTRFRDSLKALAKSIQSPGRYGTVEAMPFQEMKDSYEFENAMASIQSGVRTAVDIERGFANGKQVILSTAFSWKKGEAIGIRLDHPENTKPTKRLKEVMKRWLEDPKHKKAFHFGISDTEELLQFLGIKVKGWDYDTMYGNYFRFSWMRAHGLDAISYIYPDYAGYKDMVAGYKNFATIPLPLLMRYNMADAALSKQIELDTIKETNLSLMRVYIYAGMTLRGMDFRGPLFDRLYHQQMMKDLPRRTRICQSKLVAMSGNPDFNPGSPIQLQWLLYDHLGLPDISGGRKTDEKTLGLLFQETRNTVCNLITEFRKNSKGEGTYANKFAHCADNHDGEVRTYWHLTGATTSRLRSAGGKDGTRTNLQNIHGDPYYKNLLVSDLNWRAAL